MRKHIFTKQIGRSVTRYYLSIRHLLFGTIVVGASLIMTLALAPPVAQAAAPCATDACQVGSNYANHGSSNPATGNLDIPFGTASLVAFTNPQYTVNAPGVGEIWFGMVGVVDVFIVLMFTLTAIRVIVSGSIFRYSDVAEAVPRMLLALITAHLSFAIIGFFLGLNNALCTYLVEYSGRINITYHATDMLGFGSLMPTLDIWSVVTGNADYFLRLLIQTCLFLVKLIMVFMYIGQVVIRIIMIDLYIILSAPCIACSALPGRSGQPVTRMWVEGFLKLVFVQFVQIGGLIVAEIVMGYLISPITTMSGSLLSNILGFKDVSILISAFVGIIVLWFILRIPGTLQSGPLQTVSSGGRMIGSMASNVVSGGVSVATTAAMLAK